MPTTTESDIHHGTGLIEERPILMQTPDMEEGLATHRKEIIERIAQFDAWWQIQKPELPETPDFPSGVPSYTFESEVEGEKVDFKITPSRARNSDPTLEVTGLIITFPQDAFTEDRYAVYYTKDIATQTFPPEKSHGIHVRQGDTETQARTLAPYTFPRKITYQNPLTEMDKVLSLLPSAKLKGHELKLFGMVSTGEMAPAKQGPH